MTHLLASAFFLAGFLTGLAFVLAGFVIGVRWLWNGSPDSNPHSAGHNDSGNLSDGEGVTHV